MTPISCCRYVPKCPGSISFIIWWQGYYMLIGLKKLLNISSCGATPSPAIGMSVRERRHLLGRRWRDDVVLLPPGPARTSLLDGGERGGWHLSSWPCATGAVAAGAAAGLGRCCRLVRCQEEALVSCSFITSYFLTLT